MSRWFRHYAGMMRDEKLVRAALRSKQPIERVVWVWGAMLESAAEINDGGRFDFDAEEAAYFLRVDVTECNAVVTALVEIGRVTGTTIENWDKRQYKSDDSSDRVKRHREKKTKENQRAKESDCNGDETLRNAPETETETETEKKDSSLRSLEVSRETIESDWPKNYRDQFWNAYPRKKGKLAAFKALDRIRRGGQVPFDRLLAGILKIPIGEPCFIPHPATWLNQGRWDDEILPGESNGHRGPRPLHDDSRSAGQAAGRLADQARAGQFSFGPRPSLVPGASEGPVRLLSKG